MLFWVRSLIGSLSEAPANAENGIAYLGMSTETKPVAFYNGIGYACVERLVRQSSARSLILLDISFRSFDCHLLMKSSLLNSLSYKGGHFHHATPFQNRNTLDRTVLEFWGKVVLFDPAM